jgi:HAD superfamily hydrolase (TIGR01509 family)
MELRGLVLDYGGVLSHGEDIGGERLVERALRLLRREGCRTALLSNGNPLSGRDHGRAAELFDVMMFAGVSGLPKPAAESYLETARRLELTPQECVFVDDLPRNVAAAVAVGMVGVLHRTDRETVGEWEVLFERRLAQ